MGGISKFTVWQSIFQVELNKSILFMGQDVVQYSPITYTTNKFLNVYTNRSVVEFQPVKTDLTASALVS